MNSANKEANHDTKIQSKQRTPGKTQLNVLSVLSLNVCGLTSKIKCPDFIYLMNQYDLIGLQDTKPHVADTYIVYIDIPGYKIFLNYIEVVFQDIGQMALFL